ncbi:hypothetical protein DLM_0142 [Aquitalea magnusonii]|uniref:Uncharacterized protein n=1 Tax=Aquitalea magnusonii TaxID=332411 RepID=A0A3G9G8B6_9NEIS|nr:hypothetical protein DLM_0142 [Aquitalea magnusonii]
MGGAGGTPAGKNDYGIVIFVYTEETALFSDWNVLLTIPGVWCCPS